MANEAERAESDLAQAAGMLPAESAGGVPRGIGNSAEEPPRETNRVCVGLESTAAGLVPEESSGRLGNECTAHETLVVVDGPKMDKVDGVDKGQALPGRITDAGTEFYAGRQRTWEGWQALESRGMTRRQAAEQLGISDVTLWRLIRDFTAKGKKAFESKRDRCGRKPAYRPTSDELACVHEIYIKLDDSEVRGRGLGSSKIAAYRLAAKSDDPRIGDEFRQVVLRRKHKTVPPSWERLLDTPSSVLARARDSRSTMGAYISTPRGRTWVDESGEELPMRAGTILEADDGTFNFYAYIPWPFGGDKCSDKFGVKLGRWQLLAAVDARWEFCCSFDVVARNLGSYRGEDSGALIGRTMSEVCVPELWRMERGSWESAFVRDALDLCKVTYVNAWHSKQKSAVERFFDRFWTPASLIQGHVGRDRGRYKQVQDLALSCQDGRRDPCEQFLSLTEAMPRVIGAVQFVNSEPIESKTWGTWVPQERFEAQVLADGHSKLDPALKIFFSREQRVWTVRGNLVGGKVAGPLISFPIYFQCPELWEFEGCKVKCYFDPYTEPVLGTLVLQDEWRSYKPGHVIARDVTALELPPQVVMATDGWGDESGREKSLAIRKAIAKAVRTECWSWQGKRKSEARDGMGNVAVVADGHSAGVQSSSSPIGHGGRPSRSNVLKVPTAEEVQKRRSRLSAAAESARDLQPKYQTET